VDGAVRGTGATLWVFGGLFSRLQSGRVRAYLGASVAVVAAFFLLRQIF
jgi:hypothetical protein